MIRSISRSLGGTSLTGLFRLMLSSCGASPCSGSSDDTMGGQSIEPRLFLSDKNVRGRINGGSEKSSDFGEDRRSHESGGFFSDPFAEDHNDTHSKTPAVTVTNRISVNDWHWTQRHQDLTRSKTSVYKTKQIERAHTYLYLQERTNGNLCKLAVLLGASDG